MVITIEGANFPINGSRKETLGYLDSSFRVPYLNTNQMGVNISSFANEDYIIDSLKICTSLECTIALYEIAVKEDKTFFVDKGSVTVISQKILVDDINLSTIDATGDNAASPNVIDLKSKGLMIHKGNYLGVKIKNSIGKTIPYNQKAKDSVLIIDNGSCTYRTDIKGFCYQIIASIQQ